MDSSSPLSTVLAYYDGENISKDNGSLIMINEECIELFSINLITHEVPSG